jgi:hypothetical protein
VPFLLQRSAANGPEFLSTPRAVTHDKYHLPNPDQQLRHRCRNPHCRSKLPAPVKKYLRRVLHAGTLEPVSSSALRRLREAVQAGGGKSAAVPTPEMPVGTAAPACTLPAVSGENLPHIILRHSPPQKCPFCWPQIRPRERSSSMAYRRRPGPERDQLPTRHSATRPPAHRQARPEACRLRRVPAYGEAEDRPDRDHQAPVDAGQRPRRLPIPECARHRPEPDRDTGIGGQSSPVGHRPVPAQTCRTFPIFSGAPLHRWRHETTASATCRTTSPSSACGSAKPTHWWKSSRALCRAAILAHVPSDALELYQRKLGRVLKQLQRALRERVA